MIKCFKGNDIIESLSVHDFRECKCKSCFIDGEKQYTRIGGNPKYIHWVPEDESEK